MMRTDRASLPSEYGANEALATAVSAWAPAADGRLPISGVERHQGRLRRASIADTKCCALVDRWNPAGTDRFSSRADTWVDRVAAVRTAVSDRCCDPTFRPIVLIGLIVDVRRPTAPCSFGRCRSSAPPSKHCGSTDMRCC